jgi:hypothetical protein
MAVYLHTSSQVRLWSWLEGVVESETHTHKHTHTLTHIVESKTGTSEVEAQCFQFSATLRMCLAFLLTVVESETGMAVVEAQCFQLSAILRMCLACLLASVSVLLPRHVSI